jgi:hypothetical protein
MKEQDWFLEALLFQQTSPSVLKRSVNEHAYYCSMLQSFKLLMYQYENLKTGLFAKLIWNTLLLYDSYRLVRAKCMCMYTEIRMYECMYVCACM